MTERVPLTEQISEVGNTIAGMESTLARIQKGELKRTDIEAARLSTRIRALRGAETSLRWLEKHRSAIDAAISRAKEAMQ